MLIGTSWIDSTRRSAVTTISCSPSLDAAGGIGGVRQNRRDDGRHVAAAIHSCFICYTPKAVPSRPLTC